MSIGLDLILRLKLEITEVIILYPLPWKLHKFYLQFLSRKCVVIEIYKCILLKMRHCLYFKNQILNITHTYMRVNNIIYI